MKVERKKEKEEEENRGNPYVAYYRGVQFDKLRQLTGYYSCYGYL